MHPEMGLQRLDGAGVSDEASALRTSGKAGDEATDRQRVGWRHTLNSRTVTSEGTIFPSFMMLAMSRPSAVSALASCANHSGRSDEL